jgi:hypothetical protein
MRRSGALPEPATMQSEAMRRSGAFGASAKTTTEIDQPHHPIGEV